MVERQDLAIKGRTDVPLGMHGKQEEEDGRTGTAQDVAILD